MRKINYAVVGLGYISQIAVLPAFEHAKKNSQLKALVSGDKRKRTELGKRYGVDSLYAYEEFEDCLSSGEIDAVYIATPNTLHRRFAEMAAARGIHVLCEKPLAAEESECEAIIDAAIENEIKLMVAYRLHFDAANLKAIEVAREELGELKVFNSTFSMQVRDPNNIRLRGEMGGGPLLDIGIYCINAARYLFRDEPIEVFAMGARSGDPRFGEVDEINTCTLRFPDQRLASFSVSFGAADAADYEILGAKGRLQLKNAYEYAEERELRITLDGKTRTLKFGKHDQFAPELLYFSDCILNDHPPEPSGFEGLADVQVIQALRESISTGRPVGVQIMPKSERPSLRQRITRPPVGKARMVNAHAPGKA